MKWLLIFAMLFGAFCAADAARRVVRHENQKGFRADTNADSITQTSKARRAESFADSVSDGFAKEEEDFAEPISHCDAEEQIKA